MYERKKHAWHTVMYSFVILVDPLISWALKCFISIALIAILAIANLTALYYNIRCLRHDIFLSNYDL